MDFVFTIVAVDTTFGNTARNAYISIINNLPTIDKDYDTTVCAT